MNFSEEAAPFEIRAGLKMGSQRREKADYHFKKHDRITAYFEDGTPDETLVVIQGYNCQIRDLPVASLALDKNFSHQDAVDMYNADYGSGGALDTNVAYIVFALEDKLISLSYTGFNELFEGDVTLAIAKPKFAHLFLPSMAHSFVTRFPEGCYEEYLKWLGKNKVISQERIDRAAEEAARRGLRIKSTNMSDMLEPKTRSKLEAEYRAFILLNRPLKSRPKEELSGQPAYR